MTPTKPSRQNRYQGPFQKTNGKIQKLVIPDQQQQHIHLILFQQQHQIFAQQQQQHRKLIQQQQQKLLEQQQQKLVEQQQQKLVEQQQQLVKDLQPVPDVAFTYIKSSQSSDYELIETVSQQKNMDQEEREKKEGKINKELKDEQQQFQVETKDGHKLPFLCPHCNSNYFLPVFLEQHIDQYQKVKTFLPTQFKSNSKYFDEKMLEVAQMFVDMDEKKDWQRFFWVRTQGFKESTFESKNCSDQMVVKEKVRIKIYEIFKLAIPTADFKVVDTKVYRLSQDILDVCFSTDTLIPSVWVALQQHCDAFNKTVNKNSKQKEFRSVVQITEKSTKIRMEILRDIGNQVIKNSPMLKLNCVVRDFRPLLVMTQIENNSHINFSYEFQFVEALRFFKDYIQKCDFKEAKKLFKHYNYTNKDRPKFVVPL